MEKQMIEAADVKPAQNEVVQEAAIEQEALRENELSGNVYVHDFAQPLEYNGKKYESLVFDFGKLTGADAQQICREMAMGGKAVFSPSLSDEFLVRMALRACTDKIGIDALRYMPIRDYCEIWNIARGFLLTGDLS